MGKQLNQPSLQLVKVSLPFQWPKVPNWLLEFEFTALSLSLSLSPSTTQVDVEQVKLFPSKSQERREKE